MSHKFSFLQAFAGYYSWRYSLLSPCRQRNWFKSLSAELRVEYNRQFPNIGLLANIGKSATKICHVAGFSQIATDLELLVDADGVYKCFMLMGNSFLNVVSEFVGQSNIQRLKKYLPLQCEYLLRNIDFASIHRNIYPSFRFSRNCN